MYAYITMMLANVTVLQYNIMLESYRLSKYVHSASLMRAPDVVLGVGTDNADDCSTQV